MKDYEATGRLDILALEKGFRDAAMRAGSVAFCLFLSACEEPLPVCPDCGRVMRRKDNRIKNIVSLMGIGELSRGYFECEQCGAHYIPRDAELDMEGTSFTPGVRASVSKLACSESFEWSSDTLQEITGISVSAKECQRIAEAAGEKLEEAFTVIKNDILKPVKPGCDGLPDLMVEKDIPVMYNTYDGSGVPMTKEELAGRPGKQLDGSSATREAKLGCIFTQTATDEKGNPVRDENSSIYFGAIETAEEFGQRMYAQAVRYGLARAVRIVVIGDGARWIWNQANLHFPNAIHIVDLYHAKEHIHKLAKILHPADKVAQQYLLNEWIPLLESGKALELSIRMKNYPADTAEKSETLRIEAGYFFENAGRMKYDEYEKLHLFVGSGVIEAGCKTVIGKRLKQSGMFWSVRGANAIISLRSHELSSRRYRLSA
jgi:hypothetical protein